MPTQGPPPEQAAAELLRSAGLQHDEAQAALAGVFSVTAMEDPRGALDEASVPLFGSGESSVGEQAHALADALVNRLCLRVEERDHRALLIDHALTQRAAHPLQIAVLGHELARRAGIASFVGECDGEPWTAICGQDGMALVGPGSAPGADHPAVRPRCAHQVARATLERLRAAAPPRHALLAERLLRSLPGRGCRPRG